MCCPASASPGFHAHHLRAPPKTHTIVDGTVFGGTELSAVPPAGARGFRVSLATSRQRAPEAFVVLVRQGS